MNEKIEIINNIYKCLLCNKEFSKKGIGTHIWRMHNVNGINHDPNINYKKGTKKIWNKGLTKENDLRVKKIGLTFKNKIKKGEIIPNMLGKKHSPETILKLKLNGGYRKGSGRGKSGWYKGYWCDSSWELAFVIYNLEHNIKFERNKEGFEYEFENIKHKYYPDFILEDKTYVEIKGIIDEKNKAKILNFKYTLKIIDKINIKPYLKFVIDKYGKNFILLYENCKYKDEIKIDKIKFNKNLYNQIEKEKIELILKSDINFNKIGWVNEVSKIIDKSPQKVNIWMKRFMNNFYNEKCFKRK